MSERDYYKCRDGSLYTKHTKHEILELTIRKDTAIIAELLREMDYPWVPDQWKCCDCHFGKYIATMRLKAYSDFGWKDSDRFKPLFTHAQSYIEVSKLFPRAKIILTKRDDGDWDCVTEQVGFDGEKPVPLRITGVVEESAVLAMLTFKSNDGCLYKMEVINTDATND